MFVNCGGDNSTSDWNINVDNVNPEDNSGDWIFIHELSDSESLNPYTGNDASGSYIMANIFETMLKQDNNSLEYIPWLATSLPSISDDKLTYTFVLRKDITFSDGTPLTQLSISDFSDANISNPSHIVNSAGYVETGAQGHLYNFLGFKKAINYIQRVI